MMELFDKGLTIRMGQCHVRRWSDELLDIVRTDDDVLGLESLATHHGSLEDAPDLYRDLPGEAGRVPQGRPAALSGRAHRSNAQPRQPHDKETPP